MEKWRFLSIKIGKIAAIFQSKTLTLKNKNKIFQKFLSPFNITIYESQASENR
jgi:hypothetical protein